MSTTVSRAMRNHLVMVAIILTITSTVPTPCVSSKASLDQQAAGMAMHQLRRPYTLRPEIMVPNQHRTADGNKDAAAAATTTTKTTTGSSLQHVGKKEDLLNLQQQLAHERQIHARLMLARKALMRPTRRGIAAGRLLMAASSSLAADCDAVAVATPGSYRSWRAQWLRAGYMFKLHPMQLFFLCTTTTTKINKAATKKPQNLDGVIPVVRSRRALNQLPPAPPLTIPPLPFTIPPLPFTIPSPPRLTFPPFLPPPITFPPFPVTFPPVPPLPLSSFTPPPAVQKASVAMP